MNSKIQRKRSSGVYPSSKKTKSTTISNAVVSSEQEVPLQHGDLYHGTDVSCNEIPNGDWLTAICQSLGEVPALYEPSTDVLPQLIIDIPDSDPTNSPTTSGESAQVNTMIRNENGQLQKTTVADPKNKYVSIIYRESSKILQEWSLDDCLQVTLIQIDYKLYIHLQKCSPMDSTNVLMNIPTYVDFKDKIKQVNVAYESSSVICNNQLIIFSRQGKLVIHQIFHRGEFKLKSNPFKISHSTLLKIRETLFDIDRAIENALICDVLPEKILEQSDPLPTYFPDLMDEFILSLQREVARNIKNLYKCPGCEIVDPSHSNHICKTTDYKHQLNCKGTDAFLMLDVKRVVEDLKAKGILECFSKIFFKDLCYSDIESSLRKAPECSTFY